MALLLLAHRWVQKQQGRLVALTVDHGLRPESADEARQVAAWCKKLAIEHHILSVQDSGFRIQGGIQEAARNARYQLLTGWCKNHSILHLLVAHHQNDQAETLFFRLARGSFIDGLGCMPPVSHRHGIRILRPLLSISKAELKTFLESEGQPWIEDPTNQKLHYTRNRIRDFMDKSGSSSSLSARSSEVAKSLGVARNILENSKVSYSTKSISLFPEGYGIIHFGYFSELPPEISLRLLSALIITLSGETTPPRSEQLERLYKEIMAEKITRRTFAGLLFIHQPAKHQLLVCREPKAIAKTIVLSAGKTVCWDRRFEVFCTGKNITVRALGRDGLKILGKKTPKRPEKAVLSVLPSFWRLEELLAVPHIGYTHPDYPQVACSARFRPAKALAAHAFFGMNNAKPCKG